jgi:chemotaxis protein methyltransferase CheR
VGRSTHLDPSLLGRFQRLARERFGLEFPGSRLPDLERAVLRATAHAALTDPEELFVAVEDDPDGPWMRALVAGLTVGETHFFRNEPQFAALERHVLPDLVARHAMDRRLRLWSAGCATGEEAYSLAILLVRLLPDLISWDVSVLATDVNEDALHRAREGVYGRWSFRGVPEPLQNEYFESDGEHLSVRADVRELVRFERLNLMEEAYPSAATGTVDLDLILCRNVLIYFGPDAMRTVVRRLHGALAEGGWLVLGHAEPSVTADGPFVPRPFPRAVLYQKVTPAKEDVRPRTTHGSDSAAAGRSRSPSRRRAARPVPTVGPGRPHPGRPIWKAEPSPVALARLADPEFDDAETSPLALAELHASEGRTEEAIAWVTAAIERDPLMPAPYHLQGLLLMEAGELDGALAALRRCVYLDPTFVPGHLSLARLLDLMGQPRRASRSIENAARVAPSPEAADE